MSNPGGPATQGNANLAGGPYGAWVGTNQTALIGPQGSLVPLGGAGGGVAISAGANSQNTGTVLFSNANGVTFGLDVAGNVTASVVAGNNLALYDGANSISSGTARFSNANGVSFGFNGQTITATVATNYLTSQLSTVGIFAASNTTGTSSSTYPQNSLIFAGAGIISVGNSAGTIMISAPASTSFTQVGSNFSTTSIAGSTLGGALDTNGLTLSVPAWLTAAAGGGVNIAASNTTFTSGTVVMSNNGGALTIGSGAQSVLFSVPQTSSLSATGLVSISTTGSTISIGVPSMTVSNSAGSFTAIQLNFSNANNVTFGTSVGSIVTASVASQSVQTQASGNIAGTATAITGGASITLNSAGLSFNGTALAGTGTAITGRASITLNSTGLSFNGSALVGSGTATAKTGAIALTLSPNSSSIALSIDAGSLMGTGFTTGSTTGLWSATGASNGLSEVIPYRTRYIYPDGNQISTVGQVGNGTLSLQYLDVNMPLTGTRIDGLFSMSFSTSAGAGTQTYNMSAYAIIYTRNASTLSSVSSGSTQTTYTLASNTAGQTQFTQAAIRPVSVPVNFNMAPGEYIVGFNVVTANTAGSATWSVMGVPTIAGQNYAEITAQTATSSNLYSGMGLWSAGTTGAPAAASLSGINATGANLQSANIALVFRNA